VEREGGREEEREEERGGEKKEWGSLDAHGDVFHEDANEGCVM